MIEELKKDIVSKIIDLTDGKNIQESSNFGRIRIGSISIGKDHYGSEKQAMGASLRMDCTKISEQPKTLNYCICIYALLAPEEEQKFDIHNFFVQEQVGVCFGIPVHGNPIKDEAQVLQVLTEFNEELQKVVLEQRVGKSRTSK